MNRIKVGLLIGSAAIAVTGIALAHPGHPPIAAPAVSYAEHQAAIPFELFRGTRIVLPGSINGTSTDMILDSGAGMTVIDRTFAEKLGLKGGTALSVRGAGGDVPGKIVSGVTLTAGALRMTGLSVLVIDMAPVAQAVGRPMPVILGRDAFKAGLVTIDFPNRTIRFAARNGFAPPAGATKLQLGDEDGRLRSVKISIGGLPAIDSTLDLGNGGTLSLAQSYWSAQPSLASLRHAESQTGGVGGLTKARRVTLPAVEFAGRRMGNVPATLNEDPKALPARGGNVGIEMLKPFVVTFDDAGDAIYLQANGSTHQFQRERAGIRTELVGDRLKVAYVSPDGPAAAAGLKSGDEILAVDGRKVGADYYRLEPEWTRGSAGQAVTLARADGSKVVVTLRDYY
jgi:hypothetical protein